MTQKRYILCRATNGFNDQLNQIEISYRYAARTGRDLIIDTATHGIGRPFFEFFEPRDGLEVAITDFADHDQDMLARLSTYPPSVRGRLSTYERERRVVDEYGNWSHFVRGTQDVTELSRDAKGAKVRFDDFPLYEEELVIHHAGGGGTLGKEALGKFRLRKPIADQLLKSFVALPKNIIAFHLRYTDIKVKIAELFAHINPELAARHILLCSDSLAGLHEAKRHLAKDVASVEILSQPPQNQNRPLHRDPNFRHRREAAFDLLMDLFALSGASELIIPLGATKNRDKLVSGFARLADDLRRDVSEQKKIFALAAPDLFDAYFAHGMASVARSDQIMALVRAMWPVLNRKLANP